MTGDQQAVITKDNVSLQVSATIFCQVIDVRSALFEINDFQLAVDQLSRSVAGGVRGTLPRPSPVRAGDHQQPHAGPHGRRDREVGRAAQPDRDPRHHPAAERGAGDVGAEGGRAAQARRFPKSEGEQQAAINSAGGRKQAAVLEAEGAKQSAIRGPRRR